MNSHLVYHIIKKGLPVIPIVSNQKAPALISNFQEHATDDANKVSQWLKIWPTCNFAVFTENFVCVDIDCGKGKQGAESLLALELEGKIFPPTYTQNSPNGGLHYIYKAPYPLKGGVSVLAKHIDIRAHGQYVLAAGSSIEGKEYTIREDLPIADCPEWIVEKCGRPELKKNNTNTTINEDLAAKRAIARLKSLPPVQEGDRNHKAFIAASLVKDEGVSKTLCRFLLEEHFNCDPPLETDELLHVVNSAYKYGNNAPGVNAPERVFQKVDAPTDATSQNPIDQINSEYAFSTLGGGSAILHETTDAEGNPTTQILGVQAFQQKLANRKINIGDKPVHISKVWMESPKRRSYEGICFDPSNKSPKTFYNTWRGFAFSPNENASQPAIKAVDMFFEHALDNVCRGDKDLFTWLMDYFAHIFQYPGEKPLTALVFRGGKGVGKNTLIEIVGALLGECFDVVADKRYLTGNFNAHLENKLLYVLDEAFWSGDKSSEGVLKSLITSDKLMIERKGFDAYRTRSFVRVVVVGNEKWLVPASEDERRFAVFDVGDGKKQDIPYFSTMKKLMRGGGFEHLLFKLLNREITTDINCAPKTDALAEQKLSSMNMLDQYLYDSLREGEFAESGVFGWPDKITPAEIRTALNIYCRSRNISARIPSRAELDQIFGRLGISHKRLREGAHRQRVFKVPPVDECRANWDKLVGHTTQWPDLMD